MIADCYNLSIYGVPAGLTVEHNHLRLISTPESLEALCWELILAELEGLVEDFSGLGFNLLL